MKVIDLTHPITPDMPVYPGTEKPVFTPANSYEKDGFKETKISMFTHTGTHMDPPAHLYAGRTTLDQFPIDQFIGRALVIDVRHLKEGEKITHTAFFEFRNCFFIFLLKHNSSKSIEIHLAMIC